MFIRRPRVVSGALLALTLFGVTACGSSNNNASSDSQDSACMQELSPEQLQQAQNFTAQQTNVSNNSDGSQNICVMKDGNEHYYNQRDGFNNYAMYALLFGHSRTMMTYGLISGELSPLDYMLLSNMYSVNRSGQPYHPYSHGSNGWSRQPIIDNSVHVTNVYYGSSSAPISIAQATKAPKDYSSPTLPRSTDAVAQSTSSGQLTALKNVSASQVTAGKQQLPTSVKNVAPPAAVPNPVTGSRTGSSNSYTPPAPIKTAPKPAAPARPVSPPRK